MISGNHREVDGQIAAQALLSCPLESRPTALFVGNNEMTVGAVLAARSLGLSIPQDLSIVGFDDSRWARTMFPALTVVAQPDYELGYLGCETLLGALERRPPLSPARLRLPTTFLVRESTAPPGGFQTGLSISERRIST